MRKNQGITLIALVVTIIVLIILAGVSISLVLGENGIITKASEAKEKNERAADKEAISLAVVASQMKDISGDIVITKTNLDEELNKQLGKNKQFETTDNEDGSFFINIEDGSKVYYVEDNGNIIEENDMLKISTVEELKAFRDDVNSGNTYEGKYVYLANDITLDVNEEWEPIGLYVGNVEDSKLFKGTFDGREYIVDGIRLTTSNYQTQGLFGFVYNGIIKNLKIGENCIITGSSDNIGAIVGFMYMNSTMYNCSNNSDIVCSNMSVGGLIGTINMNAKISKCYNTGNIEGKRILGGIVGNNMTGIIESCYNTGNVKGDEGLTSLYVGGITGQNSRGGKVLNCYNIGEIKGRGIAGIVGKVSGESNIENCYNIGKITNAEISDFISSIVNYIDESKGLNFIKNNYYLENIVNEGNDTKIVEGILHKTSAELKQLYSALGSAFKEDTNNINNGYPILSWQ